MGLDGVRKEECVKEVDSFKRVKGAEQWYVTVMTGERGHGYKKKMGMKRQRERERGGARGRERGRDGESVRRKEPHRGG